MSPECVCEVSAQNTPQIIYYIILKISYFEWKQKHAIHVRIGLCLYSSFLRYSAKKHLVFIIISVVLKSSVLNCISFNFWYMVFWALNTLSTKLSSLSSYIALKLSNTHKFMLKTHMSYKNSVNVNSWERNHVYISSMWQQRYIQ